MKPWGPLCFLLIAWAIGIIVWFAVPDPLPPIIPDAPAVEIGGIWANGRVTQVIVWVPYLNQNHWVNAKTERLV